MAFAGSCVEAAGLLVDSDTGLGDGVPAGVAEADPAAALAAPPAAGEASGPTNDGIGLPAASTSPNNSPSSSTT